VKRHRPLPLFQSITPDVYVVDTSAWLNIDVRPDAEDVWVLIVALIEQGRVVACAPVIAELRDAPMYMLRLKPYEQAIQAGDRDGDDIAYLQHVGKITHDHPAMCKARGSKTLADPYVIALAELDGYVVVADESMKRSNRKIPGACQQRGIRCITLAQLVSAANAELKEGLNVKMKAQARYDTYSVTMRRE
jgi:hypothetical protein